MKRTAKNGAKTGAASASGSTATTAGNAGDPAPKAPPAQAGDAPVVEVAKAVAVPVHQSLDEGRKELDANPSRTSALTDKGHLVRE